MALALTDGQVALLLAMGTSSEALANPQQALVRVGTAEFSIRDLYGLRAAGLVKHPPGAPRVLQHRFALSERGAAEAKHRRQQQAADNSGVAVPAPVERPAAAARRGRPLGQQQIDEIVDRYVNGGQSIRTIGAALGLSYGAVHAALTASGTTLRPRGGGYSRSSKQPQTPAARVPWPRWRETK
ncbi:helix-turn-helix domain-containing protein [Dactylosporangium sp. CA-092794]|uniref:helix-turn-helix domain-containing protein n=1 Tax=Dactylosporangium sp. CA-092794 TaxID=3239929 RepID=UPI003D90EC30